MSGGGGHGQVAAGVVGQYDSALSRPTYRRRLVDAGTEDLDARRLAFPA